MPKTSAKKNHSKTLKKSSPAKKKIQGANFLGSRLAFSRLTILVVAAVMAGIGLYLIYHSLAATSGTVNYSNLDPSSVAATVISDKDNSKQDVKVVQLASAANNKAVFTLGSGNFDSGVYKVCMTAKVVGGGAGGAMTAAAYDTPSGGAIMGYQDSVPYLTSSTTYSEVICSTNLKLVTMSPGIQITVTNTGGSSLNIASFSITKTGDISTAAVKAFNSTDAITDQAWFNDMKNVYHFDLYIMHPTNWSDCNQWYRTLTQLQMALNAGLKIAIWDHTPVCWQGAINAVGQYKSQLQFFNLDIETDPGIQVTRDMVKGVAAAGVRPNVYSGSGMWYNIMGSGNNSFADVPLWDTDVKSTFDINQFNANQANLLSPTPTQYGGWNSAVNMRIGIQQGFNQHYTGVNGNKETHQVDVNAFSAAYLK